MTKPALILLAAAPALAAQDIAPKDSERDPVLSRLLEAEAEAARPAVVVDLSANADSEAVLVTGNLPDEIDPDQAPADDDATAPESDPEPTGVRVEVRGGDSSARVHAREVKLLAPFPAKPLDSPPAGWRLVHPEDTPPFTQEVELANGRKLALSIRPHVLVPDADGAEVLDLQEPGYDPGLQYAQEHTVGAVLADSIHTLDENAGRLDQAARRLQELLDSLPAPEAVAEP